MKNPAPAGCLPAQFPLVTSPGGWEGKVIEIDSWLEGKRRLAASLVSNCEEQRMNYRFNIHENIDYS